MVRSTAPPQGIYVPAVLFFDENEELDESSIRAHVLRLAKGGVTGILVQGSNGEAQHLSHEERKRTITLTRQTLDDNGFSDVIIIAGTGAQSTRETKKLCVDAKEAGATHALVLTPSTWVPQMTQENILRFHTEVADASPIPTMIYNFPTVTAGQDLDSDTIAKLAQHPNIVGTKLSCGNIGKIQRVASQFSPTDFAVFPGRSDAFWAGLNAGGAGVIAALVNLVPKLHVKLYRLHQEGKFEEAKKLSAELGHGDWAASKVGGIGGLKAVISQNFGYGGPVVRGPLKAVPPNNLANHPYYPRLQKLLKLESEENI